VPPLYDMFEHSGLTVLFWGAGLRGGGRLSLKTLLFTCYYLYSSIFDTGGLSTYLNQTVAVYFILFLISFGE